jgi:hypothetical protein
VRRALVKSGSLAGSSAADVTNQHITKLGRGAAAIGLGVGKCAVISRFTYSFAQENDEMKGIRRNRTRLLSAYVIREMRRAIDCILYVLDLFYFRAAGVDLVARVSFGNNLKRLGYTSACLNDIATRVADNDFAVALCVYIFTYVRLVLVIPSFVSSAVFVAQSTITLKYANIKRY